MKKINLLLGCALSLAICSGTIYATKKRKAKSSTSASKKEKLRSIKKKRVQRENQAQMTALQRLLTIAYGDLTPQAIFELDSEES